MTDIATKQKKVDHNKRAVLIVDDNQDAANLLSILILKMGYPVYSAYDGAEAIQVYRTYKPQIVILDIVLPDMTGYDVAAALKKEGADESTMFVALTGYGQREDELRSAKAGFRYHLTKPVSISILEHIIQLSD